MSPSICEQANWVDNSATRRLEQVSITEVIVPERSSLVGGLTSAIVHMVLLITLGLIFANVKQDGALEIQMSLANTSSSISIEKFNTEIEQLRDAQDRDRSTIEATVNLTIDEPTLNFDLGDVASTENSFDATAKLSDEINHPGSRSGEDSNKKGTFFGADAYGDEFVYVVDMSTSMGYRSEYGQTRFRVACRELLRSVNELNSNQKFCVIMFCYRTRFMFDRAPRMLTATNTNKKRLAQWVGALGLGGGTDPRYGVMTALKLKPDAIFLLSDGEFNGRKVNSHGIRGNPAIERIIESHRKASVPIHTIAFEDMLNRRRLRRIAAATSGTHRFVGNVSDQDLVIADLRSRNAEDVAYAMQCLAEGTHKIRDDKHLRATVGILASKLTASKPMLRERAHYAMLALANGDDLGPKNEEPSLEDYEDAKREWLRYWSDYFRDRRSRRSPNGREESENATFATK